jgi:hypothetical protein
VVRGRVEGLDDRGIYRRRGKNGRRIAGRDVTGAPAHTDPLHGRRLGATEGTCP